MGLILLVFLRMTEPSANQVRARRLRPRLCVGGSRRINEPISS